MQRTMWLCDPVVVEVPSRTFITCPSLGYTVSPLLLGIAFGCVALVQKSTVSTDPSFESKLVDEGGLTYHRNITLQRFFATGPTVKNTS